MSKAIALKFNHIAERNPIGKTNVLFKSNELGLANRKGLVGTALDRKTIDRAAAPEVNGI